MAANCLVQRHPRHTYTWKSFDDVYRNQIDYVLVQKRWCSSVGKCGAYQGPNCNSDHSLLGLKFKLRLRQLRKPKALPRCDYFNAAQFTVEVRNWFTTFCETGSHGPHKSDAAMAIYQVQTHRTEKVTCKTWTGTTVDGFRYETRF